MEIVLGIIFIIVGVILIVLTVLKNKHCTEVVIGKVVDISREEERDTDYRTTNGYRVQSSRNVNLYPIFEYKIGENTYVKKSNTSSSNYHIGQDVAIHYNPSNPDEYYVSKGVTAIIGGVIFIVFGIIACLAI